MKKRPTHRFQDLFRQHRYVDLKNHLYNYRLRRRALSRRLPKATSGRILEVGSGLSPVVTGRPSIVYSDLSAAALEQLGRQERGAALVVADATRLPFRDGVFTHGVSSEVLEHIEHDTEAVAELARVVHPGGRLLLTVPHRQAYFSNDDRFVGHYRRYEAGGMVRLLSAGGWRVTSVEKVLGVLEKLLMMAAIWIYSRNASKSAGSRHGNPQRVSLSLITPAFHWLNTVIMGLVWLEARWIPFPMATVLLFDARRKAPADTGPSVCPDER